MTGFVGAVGEKMCEILHSSVHLTTSSHADRPTNFVEHTYAPGCERLTVYLAHYNDPTTIEQTSEHVLLLDGSVVDPRTSEPITASAALDRVLCSGLMPLRNLNGFHSLAYIDFTKKECILIRDQWGAQTVYYLEDERGIAFSTSVLKLIPLLRTDPRANLTAAKSYLLDGGTAPIGETFFEEISQLRPLHKMTIGFDGSPTFEQAQFHAPLTIPIKQKDISFDEAVETARALFLKSLEAKLRFSSNIGFTLSGGVDSSGVVMGAQHLAPTLAISTFSYVTNVRKSIDEERFMDIVNAEVNADVHKVDLSATDFFRLLPGITSALGTPVAGASQLAQFRLYEEAAKAGVDVVINGVEADAAFCGHAYYLVDHIIELVKRRSFRRAFSIIRSLLTSRERTQIRRILVELYRRLPRWMTRRVIAITNPAKQPGWLGFEVPTEAPTQTRTRHNIGTRHVHERMRNDLMDDRLLRYAESCGAAFSIYSRTPFLDRELNEFILSLPSEFLFSSDGDTKLLLRAVLSGIVPEPILARRDKIGFEAPIREWLESEPDHVRKYLETGVELGVLSPNHDLKLSTDVNQITRAITYIEWMKTFSVRID